MAVRLANPLTPANFSLMDHEAEWSLFMQGGPGAEGFDTMPDITRRGWVTTNGSYGYGCACFTVMVDRNKHCITRLLSAQPVPLSRCRLTAPCQAKSVRNPYGSMRSTVRRVLAVIAEEAFVCPRSIMPPCTASSCS